MAETERVSNQFPGKYLRKSELDCIFAEKVLYYFVGHSVTIMGPMNSDKLTGYVPQIVNFISSFE